MSIVIGRLQPRLVAAYMKDLVMVNRQVRVIVVGDLVIIRQTVMHHDTLKAIVYKGVDRLKCLIEGVSEFFHKEPTEAGSQSDAALDD